MSKISKKIIFFLIFLSSFLLWQKAEAACTGGTCEVTDCTEANVQAAHDAAANGDTIWLNCSAATWTSSTYGAAVNVTKAVSFRGNGPTSTILSGNNISAFFESVETSSYRSSTTIPDVRITGIGFSGSLRTESIGAIRIEGHDYTFRIDNCKFNYATDKYAISVGYSADTATSGYHLGNPIYGLIDNNTFEEVRMAKMHGKNTTWLSDEEWGSFNNVYIENNTATYTAAKAATDTEAGSKYVARYNTLINSGFTTHDTGSTQTTRSHRQGEFYNNGITCNLSECAYGMPMRGGVNLIHDNVLVGNLCGSRYGLGCNMIYRVTATPSGSLWDSRCDGTAEKICSDFRGHCTGGTKSACESDSGCAALGEGTCNKSACVADSDCGSATCVQLDGQQDSYGWPCRDQTGRGKDDPATHAQALSPSYIWNNKDESGNSRDAFNMPPAYAEYLKVGRDYCANNPSEGCGSAPGFSYSTYTCPHPFAGLTGSCNSSLVGTEGYNIISGDIISPAAPSGLSVN